MNAQLEGRRRAVFRCEASAAVGAGHVMRCLTLADALRAQGWWCGFAVSPETPAAVPCLRRQADGVLPLDDGCDATAIGEWVCGHADLLVVDHYRRDAAFEGACRLWAARIAVIDDLADRPHDADLLLDQTYGRDVADYQPRVPASCRVLCGSTYALLHPAFARLRPDALARRARVNDVTRILVAFGGSDPANATGEILGVIAESGLAVQVDVVLGAAAPHADAVAAVAASMPQGAHLHADATPERVAQLMASADLAFGAGGGMAWERCCLGLPTILKPVADNQRRVGRALDRAGAALLADAAGTAGTAVLATALRTLATDRQQLARMSAAAAGLCDGQGASRLLAAMGLGEAACAPEAARLRPATLDDAERLFRWRCDPATHRYSFGAPPSWDDHLGWLRDRLADTRSDLRILLAGDRPAGTVRLDRRDRRAWGPLCEVSITIAPDCRGRGLGKAALALVRRLEPAWPLIARVKADNRASRRLFLAAGYQPLAPGVFVHWPQRRAGVVGMAAAE